MRIHKFKVTYIFLVFFHLGEGVEGGVRFKGASYISSWDSQLTIRAYMQKMKGHHFNDEMKQARITLPLVLDSTHANR